MRCILTGIARDGNGNIVPSATITPFLYGTSTATSIYTTLTGATAVNSVTAGADGSFTFYVDRFDYDRDQCFDIQISKTSGGHTWTEWTWTNVDIRDVVLGTYSIAADKTVTTNLGYVPKGVVYQIATTKTLTINGNFEAGLYKVFSPVGTGKVVFGSAVKEVYPEWWATNTTPGTTDMTAALAAAVASTDAPVILGPTTYGVTFPTAITLEGGATVCSVVMKSNMHIKGTPFISTLKVVDDTSTDGAPLYANMFASNEYLTNVSFDGVVFDFNGANNTISPLRGAGTYNRYNWAAMIWSGLDARVDNLHVRKSVFKNSPGVTSIGLGQCNTVDSLLSSDVWIEDNLFLDNGLDSDDFSAVYGWGERLHIKNNTFQETTMPKTGLIGGRVAIEVHGAKTEATGNIINNYHQGFWMSSNLTSDVYDVDISGNIMNVARAGVDFWRGTASETQIIGVNIRGNVINLWDVDHGSDLPKAGVSVIPGYQVANVNIDDNQVIKRGGSVYAAAGVSAGCYTAGQNITAINIHNLTTYGTTFGVYSNNTVGTIRELKVDSSTFYDIIEDTHVGFTPAGISLANGAGLPITTTILTNNQTIDRVGVSSSEYGLLLNGAFTNLIMRNNDGVGLAYNVGGSYTFTTMYGSLPTVSATWNPGSLADGVGESKDVTVTGAAFGDIVTVGVPYDLQGIVMSAAVKSANTVTIRLQNETTGTIDLASGSWKVSVTKP